LVQAIWLSFGCRNIPIDLSHRFFRKCREIIGLYKHNLSGAFATYCQKSFNGHRQPLWCADALEPWKVGSLWTCPPKPSKPGASHRLNDVIIQMEGNGEEQTASVQFPMTFFERSQKKSHFSENDIDIFLRLFLKYGAKVSSQKKVIRVQS
jgi:hypothetical protein